MQKDRTIREARSLITRTTIGRMRKVMQRLLHPSYRQRVEYQRVLKDLTVRCAGTTTS